MLLFNLATKSRVSTTLLLRFDNLLEWLTKLGKASYVLLPVDYKGYSAGTAKWKRCMSGPGMGWASIVLSGYDTFPALRFVHQPGSSPHPIFCKFLWLFYYVGVIEESTGLWQYSVPSPSHHSPRGVGLTAPTSNQGLVFLMTSPLLKLSGGLPRVDKLKVTSLKDGPLTVNT